LIARRTPASAEVARRRQSESHVPMSMPTTRFGRTGLTVSRLALGTMTFGLQTEEAVAVQILSKAASAGINLLDTADVYPLGGGLPAVGRTEEIVGRWLKGQRASYILATKAVGRMGPQAWDQGASRKHLLDAIDASLRRLQTDYVDLYQLHSDDSATPLDETLEALDAIVKSGRARYIGVSNFLAYRVATALGRSDLKGWTRFVSVQPRYSLLFREIERELLPLALEEGLAVIPYNPLAGGLLTGKHRPGAAPTPGTRFTLPAAGEIYQGRYWNERAFSTVQALQGLASEAGASLTTLSVAWTLANPAVTAPLLGASRPEQLDDTIAAASYQLDPALKQKLDELTAGYRRGDAPR
jgi:1-deoxyxylulose-5-phosphate synthase